MMDEMIEEIGGTFMHGYCFAKTRSAQQILSLPLSEREKFTIADVGVEMMRELLEMP